MKDNQWISVKDRLPFLEQWVLATNLDKIAVVQYLIYIDDGIDCSFWNYLSSGCGCCDGDMENVTHWMPLPEAPK